MSTTTNLITADEFEAMGDIPYELLRGKLIEVMSPTGDDHAELTMKLSWIVFEYVRAKKLGRGYAGDPGFILSRDPDTVLAPDVAYVTHENRARLNEPHNFMQLVPDIAFEVISVHDTFKATAAKAREYIGFGVPLVIVVNPRKRMLHIHRPGVGVADIAEGELFDCGEVAPGLTIDTGMLFENMHT